MAVPTISSVTPDTVHTGGRCVAEILGTGFRVVPLPPPNTGPTSGSLPVGVAVEFDGEPAEMVAVLSDTRVLVRVPPSPLVLDASTNYGEGPVAVRVQNLDDDDVPIPGEEVTLADGLTYKRAVLTVEADLTRLVRQLVLVMRREIIANVSHTTHTDYDSETADLLNICDLAETPGVAVIGPDLTENRFYSLNQTLASPAAAPGEWLQRRPPYTVDLTFTLVGVSDHKQELLNLMALVTQFFERNKWIQLQRDPNDASAGSVRYEIDFTEDGDLSDTSDPNESNIRSFSGTFVVRGFDVEGVAGFATDQAFSKTAETDDEGVRLTSESHDP